jgi:hypothetical protein
MIAKIGQKLTKKLTDLMGTCDKYLWCQMGYSDPEKKVAFPGLRSVGGYTHGVFPQINS